MRIKPFHQLTNQGRARRLRRMAFKALRQYPLEVKRLRLITNDMNGIFRVDTMSREKYVLRIVLPEGGHDIDNLRSEMMWLQALSRDTELTVPTPMKTLDGRLVIEVSCEGVPESRHCMVFSWVPGSDLADRLNEESAEKLGRLSAALHQHAATFVPPPNFRILRFDKVFPFPEPVIIFAEEFRELFPPERQVVFRKAIQWSQAALDRLKSGNEPMRVIHGDLHQWNTRLYRGVLSPIDFEDLMWGWPVQDIATTLYYFLGLNEYRALRRAFREGYDNHSTWPERYPGEIDAFIAARGVGLVNFALQDPNPRWTEHRPSYVRTIEQRLRLLLSKWVEPGSPNQMA